MNAIRGRVDEPVSPPETIDSLLGGAAQRPRPDERELAELRTLAEADPGLAAALWLSERGGIDVDAILAMRNAERDRTSRVCSGAP